MRRTTIHGTSGLERGYASAKAMAQSENETNISLIQDIHILNSLPIIPQSMYAIFKLSGGEYRMHDS